MVASQQGCACNVPPQALRGCMCVQAAFVRVHQDFTANVMRGGKPQIVKNVREELEHNLSLEEFKHWTALVDSLASPPVTASWQCSMRVTFDYQI